MLQLGNNIILIYLLVEILNLFLFSISSQCSVLEPSRTITLAEKGGDGEATVVAHPDFRIIATMNPGGDFGKKELSPALSNRFTSIWVPAVEDMDELRCIVCSRLTAGKLISLVFNIWY